MHKSNSGIPSNSMGGEDTPTAALGGNSRRARYDDDDEAEVGCMGATGGNRDAAKAIARRRRIIFLIAAVSILVLALLLAGAVVYLDEPPPPPGGAGGALGYVPRDALNLSAEECGPEALTEMARASGVDVSRVAVAEFPCGGCEGGRRRGLRASADIAEGTPIVQAEWRAVLSGEHSVGELAEAMEAAKGMSMKERLALKLMYHRFLPSSPLKPYVCSLPPSVDTPLVWDEARLRARFPEWSDAAVRVRSARQFLLQEYNKFMPLLFSRFPSLFDPATHTFAAWLWAMQTVKARNWAVNRQADPAISTAMVPFIDMINHAMGVRGAARTNLDGSRFTILAWRNYSKGDEVFTSYGDDCNLYYRLTYGFEVEGNTRACSRVNETRWWGDKAGAVEWHWATSGIGSSSVLPSKGSIRASAYGG